MNKADKNAVASFSLPEEPVKLSLLNIKDQVSWPSILYLSHTFYINIFMSLNVL